jgi:ribulose 1,5-bisphosphate synthetase/thiazole synthase
MEVLLEVDVLVAGGGPAGIGAALGAALAGARTALVEHYGFLGGVGAWCLGMPINQIRPGGKPRSRVHELLVGKLESYGPQAVRIGSHELKCNVDYLKVAALDTLQEAKCGILVHTSVVAAMVEQGRITGAVVATKRGLMAIRAKVTVDATGDADVAHFAGAETMMEAGSLSPSTLCLNVIGVDRERLKEVNIREVAARAREKYPLIPPDWTLDPVANGTQLNINHAGTRDLGQFDTTNPFQRSKAENLSRHQAVQMVAAMREFGGGALSNVELAGAGTQIGVRESRRVKGAYVLTETDALEGRKFGDAVAWRSGFLDIGFVRFERMRVHDVPYRSLLPEKIDGLLVAGRCISATHVAASAGKSMGNCMATGHAAGVAAALAVRKNVQPREVDVAELQSALKADGVDFDRAGDEQEGLV